MSQDPRKDKRAKIVSVNVRYKSATVDEFIDNHSNDVSKGGIFVKTPAPFAPGTLLKFEIRLAGDKSILGGIGRVAWKRDPVHATVDRPAGMGVKFIRIDDTSRAVIDRLVAAKADAGRAYTSELPATNKPTAENVQSTLLGIPAVPETRRPPPTKPTPITVPAMPAALKKAKASGPPAPLPRPMAGVIARPPRPPSAAIPPLVPAGAAPPPVKKATMIGVAPQSFARPPARAPQGAQGAAPPAAPTGKASEPKIPKVEGPRQPEEAAATRKATMVGMGNIPPRTEAEKQPVEAAPQATAKPTEPMFPEAAPAGASETAPEPTVMKQAAELLEEALKEAGGSFDEIGENPLFLNTEKDEITEKVSAVEVPVETTTPLDLVPVETTAPLDLVPVVPSPAADEPLPSAEAPSPLADAETPSAPTEAEETSAPTEAKETSAPTEAEETEKISTASAEPISSPTPDKLADQIQTSPKKKSGTPEILALLLLVVVAAGAALLFLFSTSSTGEGGGDASTLPSKPASEVPPPVPNAADAGMKDSGAQHAVPTEMDGAAKPVGSADAGSPDATATRPAPAFTPRVRTHHAAPNAPDGSTDAAAPAPGRQHDAAPKPETPPTNETRTPKPVEVPKPVDAAPTE